MAQFDLWKVQASHNCPTSTTIYHHFLLVATRNQCNITFTASMGNVGIFVEFEVLSKIVSFQWFLIFLKASINEHFGVKIFLN